MKNENYAAASTAQIHVTRRSPAYWRVTFNHPPSTSLARKLFRSSTKSSQRWKLTSTSKWLSLTARLKGFF
jgi:hypothetical protein